MPTNHSHCRFTPSFIFSWDEEQEDDAPPHSSSPSQVAGEQGVTAISLIEGESVIIDLEARCINVDLSAEAITARMAQRVASPPRGRQE